jgi:hypothetical protein
MLHTNYFCGTCYKTFTEFRDGTTTYLDDKKKSNITIGHPLKTGKCDNTDQTNHLVKGRDICGGELTVA